VLRLYREKYVGFSGQHFREKLEKEHNIKLSYTWEGAARRCAS
jgi:hypothetical protein